MIVITGELLSPVEMKRCITKRNERTQAYPKVNRMAPRKNFSHLDDRLADALEVVGEWWTPLIVAAVNNGSFRFESIQNALGIARNILTDRLNTWLQAEF